MITAIRNWFRRNAYGIFLQRVLIALGLAGVSILLSYLPYDTLLQAIWVIISSSFMAWIVLRRRLNETDDARYRRLFHSRFTFLENNDPEALTTIFAENLRPRVYEWIHNEIGVDVEKAGKIDALDSLAKNGDAPGQLLLRAGIRFGEWKASIKGADDQLKELEKALNEFVLNNRELLGTEIEPGLFLRHLRPGDARPVGVHMFHPDSQALLTIEHYKSDKPRHSLALSFKSHLFEDFDQSQWETFRQSVHEHFPCFLPAEGGSGPQKKSIPFFVSAVIEHEVAPDATLMVPLKKICALPPKTDKETVSEDTAAQSESQS